MIELLVVVGIISLLIGILLPVVIKVRVAAVRTRCAGSLRDIGVLFNMYLNDSRNRLPLVNTLPSLTPPLNGGLSLPALLDPYTKGSRAVYSCPADQILRDGGAGVPAGFETYFEREQSSYQYSTMLSPAYAGKDLQDTPLAKRGHLDLVTIMSDYDSFHAPNGTKGSRNYLFSNWSVGDLVP